LSQFEPLYWIIVGTCAPSIIVACSRVHRALSPKMAPVTIIRAGSPRTGYFKMWDKTYTHYDGTKWTLDKIRWNKRGIGLQKNKQQKTKNRSGGRNLAEHRVPRAVAKVMAVALREQEVGESLREVRQDLRSLGDLED